MATLLQKFVAADQWEAEDVVARLGMLLHAAFLAIGFQPCGAKPASGHLLIKRAGKAGSRCLSRRYTAPHLAEHGGGADADAAVLMLCAQHGGDVALLMFLTTERRLNGVYRERLHVATFAPLLCRALGDVEPWGSRICWRLADGVCRGLFVELCRRNRLRLTSFLSMPDDVEVEILKRLAGVDLARMECTCTHLWRLVAERDGELWKPLYQDLNVVRRRRQRRPWFLSFFFDSDYESSDSECSESKPEDEEVLNWKEKYVWARPLRSPCWRLLLNFNCRPEYDYLTMLDAWQQHWQDPPETEKTTVSTWDKNTGVHGRKVPRNEFKNKWQGFGAVHSPSSRYRWCIGDPCD